MQRLFKDTAFFQEVYDWVGSSNNMPLYFTIQRGSTIVMHTDRLQTNEVLDISERVEEEMKVALNNSEISFLANFPNREDLSETINADSSQVQEKGKRKRKDTRTRKCKREKKKAI
ncbi:uncharacterized protein [Montipora foliosa]|uniref:uncharacterized protein n=1 Tax=Montipora foliosa TaxID=591990 RepID=UPI0035F14D6F